MALSLAKLVSFQKAKLKICRIMFQWLMLQGGLMEKYVYTDWILQKIRGT